MLFEHARLTSGVVSDTAREVAAVSKISALSTRYLLRYLTCRVEQAWPDLVSTATSYEPWTAKAMYSGVL